MCNKRFYYRKQTKAKALRPRPKGEAKEISTIYEFYKISDFIKLLNCRYSNKIENNKIDKIVFYLFYKKMTK